MIECEPTASEIVEYVACPEAFSAPEPSAVVPSMKVTEPVGVPEPAVGATVAVKVRFVPAAAVVADAAKVVIVAVWVEVPPEMVVVASEAFFEGSAFPAPSVAML